MTNHLFAVVQAATNPNVIQFDTFWLGVWGMFFFVCWLVYLGIKTKFLRFPTFIEVKDFLKNLTSIINSRANNEGIVNAYIEEASQLRDSLRDFANKGQTDRIVNAINGMTRIEGDHKLQDLVNITKDIETYTDSIKQSVGMAVEKIAYQQNYYENKKAPQARRVEFDNGSSWQNAVNAQYRPVNNQQSNDQMFGNDGFIPEDAFRHMQKTNTTISRTFLENQTYTVKMRDGKIVSMLGKDLNKIQNQAGTSRLYYGYNFIVIE